MKGMIYRNLKKPGFFTVLACKGDNYGRKIDEGSAFLIEGAEFIVRPAGNARAKLTKQRNVHAFVKGSVSKLQDQPAMYISYAQEITYNPFNSEYFTIKKTGERIDSAQTVLAVKGKIYLL